MIAILGALLEENDAESRLSDRQFTIPGEHTDMEITRVGIFSSVSNNFYSSNLYSSFAGYGAHGNAIPSSDNARR
jgi:hypothetical protein